MEPEGLVLVIIQAPTVCSIAVAMLFLGRLVSTKTNKHAQKCTHQHIHKQASKQTNNYKQPDKQANNPEA